jgi:hypothetical protein
MIDYANCIRAAIITSVLVFLHGCAAVDARDCDTNSNYHGLNVQCSLERQENESSKPVLGVVSYNPNQIIAADLVNALTQVQPFDVTSTEIKIPLHGNSFMLALEQALVDRGYPIARVDRKTGTGVLMASVVSSDQAENEYAYMIAINRLALKRNYHLGANRVVAPVSSLYVRGVSPNLIKLNDGLFINR